MFLNVLKFLKVYNKTSPYIQADLQISLLRKSCKPNRNLRSTGEFSNFSESFLFKCNIRKIKTKSLKNEIFKNRLNILTDFLIKDFMTSLRSS